VKVKTLILIGILSSCRTPESSTNISRYKGQADSISDGSSVTSITGEAISVDPAFAKGVADYIQGGGRFLSRSEWFDQAKQGGADTFVQLTGFSGLGYKGGAESFESAFGYKLTSVYCPMGQCKLAFLAGVTSDGIGAAYNVLAKSTSNFTLIGGLVSKLAFEYISYWPQGQGIMAVDPGEAAVKAQDWSIKDSSGRSYTVTTVETALTQPNLNSVVHVVAEGGEQAYAEGMELIRGNVDNPKLKVILEVGAEPDIDKLEGKYTAAVAAQANAIKDAAASGGLSEADRNTFKANVDKARKKLRDTISGTRAATKILDELLKEKFSSTSVFVMLTDLYGSPSNANSPLVPLNNFSNDARSMRDFTGRLDTLAKNAKKATTDYD
jgi:hypothetical protein